jgi:hypothetical protein
MTHGEVWILIDPKNPDSPVMNCEAHSDGYLSGVGAGLVCSSARIDDIAALGLALACSPVFYEPTLGRFYCKEGDSLIEYLEDTLSGPEAERIQNMLEETGEQVIKSAEDGDIEAVLQSGLGKMTMQEKIDAGWVAMGQVRQARRAWRDFVGDSKVMGSQEAAEFLVERMKAAMVYKAKVKTSDLVGMKAHAESFKISCASYSGRFSLSCTSYMWNEGQFWSNAVIYTGDDKGLNFCAPLIMLCAVQNGSRCHGDFPGYLGQMTRSDNESLMVFLAEMKKRSLVVDDMFGAEDQVRALFEARELDVSVKRSAGAQTKARAL